MPPTPAYNWFCVLYGAAEVLSHAAQYRAGQLASTRSAVAVARNRKGRTQETPRRAETREDTAFEAPRLPVLEGRQEKPTPIASLDLTPLETPQLKNHVEHDPLPPMPKSHVEPDLFLPLNDPSPTVSPIPPVEVVLESIPSAVERPSIEGISDSLQNPQSPVQELPFQTQTRTLKSSKVPSSRIGRLFHYGGLAASLSYGVATELIRRTGSSETATSSVMMSEGNIRRLVSKLSEMRGAALKLGQFMSIQDSQVLPPEVDKIFRRVQDSAHYMPDWQMEQVMSSALGPDWLSNFASFDRIPFAAASIGQVHRAVLSAAVSPTGKEEPVAVKIQFPNIVNSIESDLGYIKLLLTASKVLPKGLFLDKTISVMKDELADECDYVREASFLKHFGSSACLGNDLRFKVPWVWDGSTSNVLVMERVEGVSVGEGNAHTLSQEDRNDIGARIIELCLMELFTFRAMQTDPNWSNFLWNPLTRQVELVDFGATRTYSKEFMDNWFSLLQAAASGDRQACIDWSLKLGYITGGENEIMLNAHVDSMSLLATPFKPSTPQPFAFGPNTPWADITAQIRTYIPIMIHNRLTPPPRETYSLNRKLSGSFLLASRLGSTVDTFAIWKKVTGKYQLG